MICFMQFSVLTSNLNMFTTHRPNVIQDRELNEDIPAFPAIISASSIIIQNMHEMNKGPHHPQAPHRAVFLLMSPNA